MKNRNKEVLFKSLVVIGCLFGALLYIYPIVYAIVKRDDIAGLMVGFKIILFLFIITGLSLAMLMIFGGSSLTKTKLQKKTISYSNMYELMKVLHKNLSADGYSNLETSNNSLDSYWIYKKSRLLHEDYFIVFNLDCISHYQQPYNLYNILNSVGVESVRHGIFIFCCSKLESKDKNIIINFSKERINCSYLTAVVDFQESMLSIKKITDGFAKKRQHKNINRLLSYFYLAKKDKRRLS